MKKLLFFISFVFLTLIVMPQSQRQMVLSEDFTSTLCPHCPPAALGMDSLLAAGQFVAVVASHSDGMGTDPYANTYSIARNNMYGVQAFPIVAFDAIHGFVGTYSSGSMYPYYLPLYNDCMAISSPLTMSMSVTNTGLNYTAVVTLTETGTISSSNNVLYFFVTESNINYNWEGQHKLQHVNRLMVPDQNGTAVDFSSGNTQTVTLTFSMDNTWVIQNCEFIAAFQDMDAGQGTMPGTAGYPLREYQVYQTIKRGAIDLTPGFYATPNQIPLNDSVTFTDTTFGGYIGTPQTYHWIFTGGTPDTSNLQNPVVWYLSPGSWDVTLIVNRGGQIDTVTKTGYIYVGAVGINELSQNVLTIFPNPVKDVMTVQANNNIKEIYIYNETGQVVINQMVSSKTTMINTSGLSAGIYYMKAILNNGTVVKKVVIE